MSSFSQNRRRKNAKSDINEIDEENANNEEEEDMNDEDGDSSSSKEYDTFDGSPEPRRGKRRKNNQGESGESETLKRSSGRMRRHPKANENQTESDNSTRIKKKNMTSTQSETEKSEDLTSPIRNSTPTESTKKSRAKRLLLLLGELKSSIIQLECEFESPSLAAFIIEDFLLSNQNSIDSIIRCFSSFYDEYKHFLKALSLKSSLNELYEYTRSLEIEILAIKEDDTNLPIIQEFISKIEKIRSPITTLEPFNNLVINIRALLQSIPKDNPLFHIITKIFEKLIPLAQLLNTLNITNHIIHVIGQVQESFETLSIKIPEYNNIELQPYEPAIFPTYQPNPYFVDHCLELVSELEREGIIMTSTEIIADNKSLIKIVAPNIQKELNTIHDNLVIIANETSDESLKSTSDDISQKPASIVQLFMLEKKLKLDNVRNPSAARTEALCVLNRFRILHSLFLILESEKLISYSNAVHLTYFRTFAAELAHEDMLSNQSLLTSIDYDILVKIALQTTQKVNPDFIDQRIQFKIWLYMSSVDVFNFGFGKPDDSFHTYLQWFTFFTTIQAETDKKDYIISEMSKLPPLSEYKEKVLSFLTEEEFEIPNVSMVVHLQLIFQAELSDTCINYQSSLINQLRTTCYLKQYRKMLQSAIDDGFITVPEGFSMNDDIRSFNEHHWDLSFNDILPFLYNLSDLLPPLSPSTVDLHKCFARLHSGYISYENVARFGEMCLKYSTEFSDPANFVLTIEKFSHYALYLDFHDQLVMAHALASDPPFSMTRNVNLQILCRTIANQLLMLNTASVFEATKSKEIAVECGLLRIIANAVNPALLVNPQIREKLIHCLHNINGFFESPTYGMRGILNQVRINFALNRIENDEINPFMDKAIAVFNKIEPSIQMNQDIIDHYFDLLSILDQIKEKFPDEEDQCDFIMNNIKLVAIISQLKEECLTAGNGEHSFNCIFPVSIKDKMGEKVPIMSSVQPLLISKNHFPFPDKPLNISQQNRLIRLFQSLQEERQKLVEDVSLLQQLSEKRLRLQEKVAQLFEERKRHIDDFNSNRKEMEKLYAQMAERKLQNEQRSHSLVVEGAKISPEEVKIVIEQKQKVSNAIRERIKLIETQLACFESSLKDSNEDVLNIEKEIIDIRIQKSIVHQKNKISIEMKKAAEIEEEKMISEADAARPSPLPSDTTASDSSSSSAESAQLDPSLHSAIPSWLHVSEKVFTKIEKEINTLNKTTEEAGSLSKKYLERNSSNMKSAMADSSAADVDHNSNDNDQPNEKPEVDKLYEEIKAMKKKRDDLYTFITKTKKAIDDLLSNL
ncbi:hypothetical protein M9Y10_005866 [Tritrichomonas musculus]|uniref:Uncharacterized protein n=1 Tax=Tritrichomonas musculus TaxID=1915356 RepID=A0ABR2JD62_9EUKA